jgi:hypothetical protein
VGLYERWCDATKEKDKRKRYLTYVEKDDLHGLIAGVLQAITHAGLSETPRRIARLVAPTLCGIAGRASYCRLQSNEARRPV